MERNLYNPTHSEPEAEKTATKGIKVFREGLREARRNGDQIDLYYMDGRYDSSEPITAVQKDGYVEIIDMWGAKIGTFDTTEKPGN